VECTETAKWYLTVVCSNRNCVRAFSFLKADENSSRPPNFPIPIELKCPHCHETALYESTRIVRSHIRPRNEQSGS
jgi:hypothetical protein